MAQPHTGQVHVDRPLTNISVAYLQKQSAFIAGRVFPMVPVDKQSDSYFKYTKGDWFRDEARPRAPGTESAGGGYTLATDTYNCKVEAFHKDVDDQTRANSDAPLNPDRDATEFVTQRLLLRGERDWVSKYFGTGVWGTDKTGGSDFTVWSNYASSDPIADFALGIETILKNTGMRPNLAVLGYPVYKALRNHPDLVDRIKYTVAGGIPTNQAMAEILGVGELLVAEAVYNSAVEGAAVSMDFIHGKHALLCHRATSPSLLTPSAGYTFAWKGVSQGMGTTVGIGRFRMEHLKSDRIEGEIAYDHKVVATDLGYFFSGAVS